MPGIQSILVANRGEIARRILRCAKGLGLRTVAVYSREDEGALFVRDADSALCIGSHGETNPYLAMEAIVTAAKSAMVDAVHPGYGFLSENAAFARRCKKEGLIFVGPPASVIEALGKKTAAKEVAKRAGVPVVPSYEPEDISNVAFPVLLKASAGGGGKGMRVVHKADELPGALAETRRLAKNAFGDEEVMLEACIRNPRHIEIQILADSHGNVVHLFERECSIQRRHQKVIEESPAPNLDASLRDEMAKAALGVAKESGYIGAGTVEFIVSDEGKFYFLEVNTRLQVEHPVTEEVLGVDLVEQQIRIAGGETLGLRQDDLVQKGHAIEVRLYAEDPDQDFLPSCGTLAHFSIETDSDLRLESGVAEGQTLLPHYDPMMAKLITWGDSRDQATFKMRRALQSLEVVGVQCNRDYLLRILEHPRFAEARLSTSFLSDEADALGKRAVSGSDLRFALTAAALFEARATMTTDSSLPAGYRNNRWCGESLGFSILGEEGEHWLSYQRLGSGFSLTHFSGRPFLPARAEVLHQVVARVLSRTDRELQLEVEGLTRRVGVVLHGDELHIFMGGHHVALRRVDLLSRSQATATEGNCVAPMPAKVVAVCVEVGSPVKKGDALVIVEAMKMEHTIRASKDGTVAALLVACGEQVAAGQRLAELSER